MSDLVRRVAGRKGRAIPLLVFALLVPTTLGDSAGCGGTKAFTPRSAAALQTALDCAVLGATITLAAGRTYQGTFTLRYKAPLPDGSTPPITIQSSAAASLPAHHRVGQADVSRMARLKVASGSRAPVVETELVTLEDGTRRAASHYRLAGIVFETDAWVNHLVRLGSAREATVDELPSDIGFDRCLFAGSPGEGSKQGLVANGRHVVVRNSFFRDFKDTAHDAQAIIMWNGAGPLLVENNHLEGSGENLMIGGGDPTIRELVPADITIARNHFFKPLGWTSEQSTRKGRAFGRRWRIKNLLELKNAERVRIDGNVLENNWIQADQQGFAVLLSTRNQGGGAPWSRIRDVAFTNNLIRNSIAGMKFLVTDDTHVSGQMTNVVVRNNLFVNIQAAAVPGTPPGDRAGRLMQVMNPSASAGPLHLTLDRNTAFASGEVFFAVSSPIRGVTITNNVVRHNRCTAINNCGISGDGTRPGVETLRHYFATATPPVVASCAALDGAATDGVAVCGNVFAAGGSPAQYPAGNDFPASVSFRSAAVDPVTGLAPANADYTAGDGSRGVDWVTLKRYVDAAISGAPLR